MGYSSDNPTGDKIAGATCVYMRYVRYVRLEVLRVIVVVVGVQVGVGVKQASPPE